MTYAHEYIKRQGDGYSYELGSLLLGDVVDFGIKTQDESLNYDFAYLDSEVISLLVQRLDIEFLGKTMPLADTNLVFSRLPLGR